MRYRSWVLSKQVPRSAFRVFRVQGVLIAPEAWLSLYGNVFRIGEPVGNQRGTGNAELDNWDLFEFGSGGGNG
jgi:hypothetical protein